MICLSSILMRRKASATGGTKLGDWAAPGAPVGMKPLIGAIARPGTALIAPSSSKFNMASSPHARVVVPLSLARFAFGVVYGAELGLGLGRGCRLGHSATRRHRIQ